MARKGNNLPAKKYKSGERTERTLRFKWNAGDDTSVRYIDIAKALSMVNRRAYRQGLYYYVSGGYFVNGSSAHMSIDSLPDNYVTKLAWKRGFKNFQEMNRRATVTDEASIYPQYHDFKVSYGAGTLTGAALLDPGYGDVTANAFTEYTCDAWDASQFVSDDPPGSDPQVNDEFLVHMLGPHTGNNNDWTSIGLIASLNDTWPQMPENTQPTLDGDADTDPISNLFDAGESHQEIREHLDLHNDTVPYDRDLMNGATSIHEGSCVALCRTSAGAGAKMSFGGFCAPMGLLQVTTTDFGDGSSTLGWVELVLELTPGPYHGVYAERI